MNNTYYGIYQGIVSKIDDSEEKRGRIKVLCPSVLGVNTQSAWCEPVVPVASDFYIPKINDLVWIMFIEGKANKPVYIGSWWTKENSPIGKNYSGLNDVRIISFGNCRIALQSDNTISIATGDKEILKIQDGNVTITGNVNITGNITVSGNVKASGTVKGSNI